MHLLTRISSDLLTGKVAALVLTAGNAICDQSLSHRHTGPMPSTVSLLPIHPPTGVPTTRWPRAAGYGAVSPSRTTGASWFSSPIPTVRPSASQEPCARSYLSHLNQSLCSPCSEGSYRFSHLPSEEPSLPKRMTGRFPGLHPYTADCVATDKMLVRRHQDHRILTSPARELSS